MVAQPPQSPADDGERLAGQTRRLRLLVQHLAGPAIRARVEPEDIVQEICLRAVSAPGGLPAPDGDGGESGLWAFLARIARNTVIDIARAARAARRSGPEQPLDRSQWSRVGADLAARTAGPATRAAAAEAEQALARAFDGLAADHRRVIGLRQFEGLSAAETAVRMGRSEAAVHSLYRRALAAWHEALPRSLR